MAWQVTMHSEFKRGKKERGWNLPDDYLEAAAISIPAPGFFWIISLAQYLKVPIYKPSNFACDLCLRPRGPVGFPLIVDLSGGHSGCLSSD
ncbi:hypothetical protein [Shinella sp. NM-101]|uniref:hypothetical protein n=1 Tax=Shinella sp. NM-101 TaxID=2744455 RepID=UPI001F336674|nr:hypothetical protein [Shinella sp. NM-101]